MEMSDFDPAYADAVGAGSADAAPVGTSEPEEWEAWLARLAVDWRLAPEMEPVTIERASEITQISPRMLRYMENEGVFRPKRTAAGYRLYDYYDLLALALIAVIQQRFGVTTAEMRFLRRLSDDRCLAVAVRTLGRLTRRAVQIPPRVAAEWLSDEAPPTREETREQS